MQRKYYLILNKFKKNYYKNKNKIKISAISFKYKILNYSKKIWQKVFSNKLIVLK
jgi:hypothetical protein